MFGAGRVLDFPARVYRLTLTVESKSQGAASASKSVCAVTKNGSKKKVGIRFYRGSIFS
jgi:hypothetical protein